jgi:hypothetical protein
MQISLQNRKKLLYSTFYKYLQGIFIIFLLELFYKHYENKLWRQPNVIHVRRSSIDGATALSVEAGNLGRCSYKK